MGKTSRSPKRNPRKIGKRKHLKEEEDNRNWKEHLEKDRTSDLEELINDLDILSDDE